MQPDVLVGTTTGLLVAALIGGIIGWLASIVMRTNVQMGLVANVVIGIVGAAIGGGLSSLIGTTGAFGAYIMPIIGAMLLIGILKVLGIFK